MMNTIKEAIYRAIYWLLKLDPVCAVEVPDPEHYDAREWRQ